MTNVGIQTIEYSTDFQAKLTPLNIQKMSSFYPTFNQNTNSLVGMALSGSVCLILLF